MLKPGRSFRCKMVPSNCREPELATVVQCLYSSFSVYHVRRHLNVAANKLARMAKVVRSKIWVGHIPHPLLSWVGHSVSC